MNTTSPATQRSWPGLLLVLLVASLIGTTIVTVWPPY